MIVQVHRLLQRFFARPCPICRADLAPEALTGAYVFPCAHCNTMVARNELGQYARAALGVPASCVVAAAAGIALASPLVGFAVGGLGFALTFRWAGRRTYRVRTNLPVATVERVLPATREHAGQLPPGPPGAPG